MSNFGKGLITTAISIGFLIALKYAIVAAVDPYGVGWILGAGKVYCMVGMVLLLVFFAFRGKRTLATGMLTGTVIGIFLWILPYWGIPV